MAIWDRKRESREEQTVDNSMAAELRAALGGTTAVTVSDALSVPAVAACVGIIASAVSELPVKLYRETNGAVEEVLDDYRLPLLNAEPGDLMDAQQWKHILVRDYLLTGGGYSYPNWVGNRMEGIYYISPMDIAASVGTDPIFKSADFTVGGKLYQDWQIFRMLRATRNGATGTGVAGESALQLAVMLESIQFERNMVRTGAKKGFLKSENKLADNAITSLKTAIRNMFSNQSEETYVLLNKGIDFLPIGNTAVETQLSENKNGNRLEVCSLFHVAPSILVGNATDADLENTKQFGIIPVAEAFASACNRFCLLEEEKKDLYFALDTTDLLKGDLLKRYQAYAAGIQGGFLQPDEVRYQENKNQLGLKYIRMGLDTVLYDPETGGIYTPNTDKWMKLKGERQT